MIRTIGRAAALALVLFSAGCEDDSRGGNPPFGEAPVLEPGDVVTTDALVVWMSGIEGSCWTLLVAGRGGFYHPRNLPEEFKKSNLPVRVTVSAAPDYVGFCPGQIVSIDSIRHR